MGKRTIIVTLFVAAILRLVAINQSLWLDEAIGAVAARDFSYQEIISNFITIDNHTPGYYLLLKFWATIFGFSELALRSLSIIFGVLTVYLTYRITQELVKKNSVALFAALLLATSQIHIYYSQEARMYSMAAFLASLAVLSFIRAIKANKNAYWVTFSLSILLLIITDYMPVFLLPIFPLYVLLRNKSSLPKLLLSFTPLVAFGVLWFPLLKTQLFNYSTVSNSFLFGGATVKQLALVFMKFTFGRLSFEPKSLYYGIVVISSIPIFISLVISFLKKKHTIIWLWFAVPLVSAFIVSFLFPAFSYFRFIYILPAFYILIALAQKKILIYLAIIFNLAGVTIYYADVNQQREQWRQAVSFVESNISENSIVLFEFPEPFAPYRWYENKVVNASGATDSISANELPTIDKTKSLIKDKDTIYYFEYLGDVSDPNRYVEKVIIDSGFIETAKTSEFVGVGAITTYEKIR